MGLIKTAMMSGAAMYGINKLAQTAQSRNNNTGTSTPPPPPRDYPERHDPYYSRREEYRTDPYPTQALEYRDDQHEIGSFQRRDYHETEPSSGYYANEPRQRVYYQDEYSPYGQGQSSQSYYDRQSQQESARRMQSPSEPPPYFANQRRPQGFIEGEEIMDDPRTQQSGSRTNMVNMLAQQAMSMGLAGGRDGQKDGGKGDLLKTLLGK